MEDKKESMEIGDISKLKIGDRVHYIPFEGCDYNSYENGMVKEIPGHTNDHIRVVFHCAGEWKNFMNYTSQLTPVKQLRRGWFHAPTIVEDFEEEF